MRTGKRSCRIQLYRRGQTEDAFGDRSGQVLWREVWGDIVAERGTELTVTGERDVQTYPWVSIDYLDLCEGKPPKLLAPQDLASMILIHDDVQYDVDALKVDYITKREVILRLVQKSGGN